MKISLDENYRASTDVTTLGYVGETNARTITIENYQCEGADSYKMRFKYPDSVVYDVDVSGDTYTIKGSILRRVGDVYLQILACRSDGDTYEFVKKSNILTLHICSSLNGEPAPVPTYEKSVEALEKVLLAEKSSAENVSKAEISSNAAQAAQNAAEQAKQTAVELAASAEKAAENATQSEIAAQTAANIATDEAAEISKSTDDIAKLYSKSDGIVCSAEGTEITLNDSSDLGFSGMRIFGRSTQDGTPSPDYPQEIVSAGNSGEINVCANGKNLLPDNSSTTRGVAVSVNNGVLKMNGTVNNINTVSRVFWASRTLKNILVPGKTYYLWCDNPDIHFRFFVSNAQQYNVAEYTVTGDETSIAVWLILGDIPQAEGDKIDITARVSLSECEPQTMNISTPNGLPGIPVDSGGNYTDENGQQWVCDEIDLGRGVYVQRLFSVELNGNPTLQSINEYGIANFGFTLSQYANADISKLHSLCNRFDRQSLTIANTKTEGYMVASETTVYLRVKQERATTTSEIIEYLSENPTIILYILSEPIETPLTAEEIAAYKSLHTNKPTTVITNSDNAHMAVDYTADTKTYIDNKFNELATAIIATGGDT